MPSNPHVVPPAVRLAIRWHGPPSGQVGQLEVETHKRHTFARMSESMPAQVENPGQKA